MPLYPIFYLLVTFGGWIAGLMIGPIWALLTYVFVYFNIPQHQWWGGFVPDIRWSLTAAGVLVISCLIHKDQLRHVSWLSVPGFRWLLCLLIVMIAIVPFSVNSQISWPRVYDFFRYVVIFLLIVLVINDLCKLQLYISLFLSQVFYLSWMAHSYFRGARLDGIGTVDARGANEFAILLVSVVPFLIIFLLQKKWYKRIASICMLPFILNAFAMCRSRSGFLGIVTSMMALSFSERNRRVRFMLLGSICLGCVMLYLLMDPAYVRRIFTIEAQPLEESSAGRIDIWKYMIKMTIDYPWGTGGGGFMYLSPKYIPKRFIEKNVGQRASHNTYLLILVEQGSFGLLIFILFIKDIFSYLYKSKLLLEDRKEQYATYLLNLLCMATLSSFAGILVAGFFNDRLYYEGLYLVAALAPVSYYLALNQGKEA